MATGNLNDTVIGILLDTNNAKQNAELLIYDFLLSATLKAKFNSRYVANCHLLNVGTISYYYNFFKVPYFKELSKFDTATNEFGFLNLWETIWMAKFNRRAQKMPSLLNQQVNITTSRDAVLKSKFVTMSHLGRFFTLCIILGGMCVGVFYIEKIQSRKSYWCSVLSTFACLQYFKVGMIINRVRYVYQK